MFTLLLGFQYKRVIGIASLAYEAAGMSKATGQRNRVYIVVKDVWTKRESYGRKKSRYVDRNRERREIERQERKIDRPKNRQIDKQVDRQSGSRIGVHRVRETDRQTDW